MKRIHILSPGFSNPNSCAFLYPFFIFQSVLEEANYTIRIFNELSEYITACDVLLIEHKAMTRCMGIEAILISLAKLSEQTSIIWCDQSDSTGTFLGQVLPYVKKYLKAQILADPALYKNQFYADRIYTDYYHRKHDVVDEQYYDYQPALSNQNVAKIDVSWNSGLMNNGYWGPYVNRLLKYIQSPALTFFSAPFADAQDKRFLDLSCRMGIPYARPTVRFQRESIRKILRAHTSTDKLSRLAYLRELSQSKLCISPFGYGEITLKDFEAFLTGSALLKPNMSHLKTWPNFYENGVTYISHSWDLDDLEEKIDWALSHDLERTEIAYNAQNCYSAYTKDREAPSRFLKHFQEMIQLF